MLEIVVVVLALAGVFALVGFVFSLIGLLLRLLLLPFTIGLALLKGAGGLLGGLLLGGLGLVVALVIVPAALLTLLSPLLLPVAVNWLVVRLARRRPSPA
ncbi:MAG: hypothetical protein ACYDIE_06855 [Candidatus Krumholzibacteriia bacterium]